MDTQSTFTPGHTEMPVVGGQEAPATFDATEDFVPRQPATL